MTRHTKRFGLFISLVAAMMVVSTSVVLGAGLTITSFTPGSGSAGTTVVITGSGFTGATRVTFGTAEATFHVDSDTQITTTVPATAPARGKISVTTPTGRATCSTQFTRPVAAKPTITSFTPASGGAGTYVVLTGTHFTGTIGVTFGGVVASFRVDSDSQITTLVPAAAPAKGRIKVTTPAGSAKSSTAWVRGAGSGGAPASITVTPSSARPGAEVRISGSDLAAATDVEFGGVSATVFFAGPTSVYATVPSGARSGPVTVTAPGGSWQTASDFTVIAFLITSLSPDRGPVGSQVVITGAGFTGATRLMFNGVDATFAVKSDTKITATVPVAATTGTVRVWVGLDSAATSPGVFTVTS